MSHHYYIAKAPDDHLDSPPFAEISMETWLWYIANDPELTPDPSRGQGFVVWSGNSKYKKAWFDWDGGSIITKNPDAPTLGKMLRIAEDLGAYVANDDGCIVDGDELLSVLRNQSRNQSLK